MSTDPTDGPGAPTTGPHAVFAELGQMLLDQPLGQYLQRVADLATASLPGVDSLSVTLVEEDGTARSAAFTGAVATMLDERQYETGFGPCLDAATSGQTVRVDLDAGTYPAFADVARRQGVRAAAAVGMPIPQRVVGSLNLYSTSSETLDEQTLDQARTLASYAAVAMANAALYDSTARLAEQLQEAMQSRAVIEQAKGVLMATLHLEADDAFAHLSRISQRSNTKLRNLAADVMDRARRGQAHPGLTPPR